MRLRCLVAFVVLAAAVLGQDPSRHAFHRDHVLGTSLDLLVEGAGEAEASACLDAVLDEVERLRAILSSFDAQSPLSALNRGVTVAPAPLELIAVLEQCEAWRERSHGAFDARAGGIIALWREAAKAGAPPAVAEVGAALEAMRASGWRIDRGARTLAPLGAPQLVVDGLAKGFIVDRALMAARRKCPGACGVLLDIGGDMAASGCAMGREPWRIGIADPARPQDNAPLLCELALGERAVATSGSYARPLEIAGKRYSRIVDPRRGVPATGVASATAVAKDCTSADALATILCVLPIEQGLALIESTADAECLIVGDDGERHQSPGFAALLAKDKAARADVQGGGSSKVQDAGFAKQLEITLVLEPSNGRRYRRPYVAVWIEDEQQNLVRTVALWGTERRYVSELSHWWNLIEGDRERVHAVSRATRAPGEYRLLWNGEDESGARVRPGRYVVCIEIAREHGGHTIARTGVSCGAAPVTVAVRGNAELQRASLRWPAQAAKD